MSETPAIVWVRLAIGTVLMGFMGYEWIYVKEFDEFLFVIPATLMGVNPFDIIKGMKK